MFRAFKSLIVILALLAATSAMAGYSPFGWQGWLQSVATITDAPSSGVLTGSVVFAQDTDSLYYWSGASWVEIVGGGGSGTVTSVSVSSANGFAGTVANPTTTPAITVETSITGLLHGNGTAVAAETVSSPLNESAGTLTCDVASGSQAGCLSSADWTTFNSKQSALTIGDLTDAGTDGITVTGGTGAVIGSGTSLSQHVADTSDNGYLSSTDWNTFNGKQPAGNYITALTGDVTATGPGSVAATVSNSSYKRYINFVTGDDSSGTGSDLRPWKTLQQACTAVTGLATINTPFVLYLSGGNNDTDAAPITCPPNINIVSDYPIQLSQNLTITGGITNDTVSATNIVFEALTWVRNDATQLSMTLTSCFFSGLLDFEQQGSGVTNSSFFMNRGGLTSGATIDIYQTNILAIAIYSALTFKDAGAGAFATITGADLYTAAMDLSGGFDLELAGDISDSGYSITGHTTGSGTPVLMSDDGSLPLPASITGAYSIVPASNAQYVKYSPATPGNWSPAPALVSDALDQLAARTLTFADSLVNTAGTVTLVNDSATPGASKYYGTDGSSTLGYFALPTGTPGGSPTDVQYNSSGSFGGDSGLTYDGSGNLTMTAKMSSASANISGLTDSEAVFTDGSDNLVSNAITGTGNVVMSTSPTLVTPALGTPSALVLTNATGLPIAGGGTGQTTANAALNALLPSQTGESGNFLTTDGTNTSWAAGSGGITALTGDVTASGSGSVVATLAATSNATLATLSALTSASSLATVGTIGTGTWQGTKIGAAYGGTGIDTSSSTGIPAIAAGTWSVNSLATTFVNLYETVATTAGDLIYGGVGGTPTRLPAGTSGQVLGMNSGGTAPTWISVPTAVTTGARYYGSTSSISSTPSLITYVTEDFDTNSAYSSGVYTIPLTGIYSISAGIYPVNSGTNVNSSLYIYKNGSAITQNLSQDISSISDNSISVSDQLSLSAGDTISIYASSGSDTSINASNTANYFSVGMLSGTNVTSTGPGAYHTESASFSCTSGGCTATSQTGSWFSGISRSSAGEYTISFSAGEFSAAPTCTVSNYNAIDVSSLISAPSTSSVSILTFQLATGDVRDDPFGIVCMGPH